MRGSAGHVRLHGAVPSWRHIGSSVVTEQRPAAVAVVEAQAQRHFAAQQSMLRSEPGAIMTGQDRLLQPEPEFAHAAEAGDVREQEMLRLSVYCGAAARIVAGGLVCVTDGWVAGLQPTELSRTA